MIITPELREEIDRSLKEADEWNEKHGNETYTIEEVREHIREILGIEEKQHI